MSRQIVDPLSCNEEARSGFQVAPTEPAQKPEPNKEESATRDAVPGKQGDAVSETLISIKLKGMRG